MPLAAEQLSFAPSDWSPDKVEIAKRLWTTGSPASAIGLEIGMSRSAVIGKMHRLGVSKQTPDVPKQSKIVKQVVIEETSTDFSNRDTTETVERVPAPVSHKPVAPTAPPKPPANLDGFPFAIPLIDAKGSQCRYPLWREGDRIEDKHVCGAQALSTKSWCRTHYDIVFEPPRPGRRQLVGSA